MLTINIIGKNCNVKIDGNLYTIVLTPEFNLDKLKTWGMSYYYNLNQSKEYFDEFGEHQIAQKREKFKTAAKAYKDRILKLVLEEVEKQKVKKEQKNFSKKLEKRKLETELKQVKQKFKIYKKHKDLEVKQDEVYLKGLDFKLPQEFLDVLIKEENPKPLINFMIHVALNPNPVVREKIWKWVHTNGFKITENGYIYAVRWVVKKELSELDKFVQTEYAKKKIQKKSPKNYLVWKNKADLNYVLKHKDYCFDNEFEIIDNLNDLYFKVEEAHFTDNHTKTFKINIGTPVKMNREDCDSSGATCSYGLHGVDINYALDNRFGDTLIGILVSPTNVASIPDDNYKKFRCCEYLPIHILDEESIELLKNSELVISDVDYEEINFQELYESLVGKNRLFNGLQDRTQIIKDKLKSMKGEIPVKEELKGVLNRIVKL